MRFFDDVASKCTRVNSARKTLFADKPLNEVRTELVFDFGTFVFEDHQLENDLFLRFQGRILHATSLRQKLHSRDYYETRHTRHSQGCHHLQQKLCSRRPLGMVTF